MVSPISQEAVDYVRQKATEVMQYTCIIHRVNPPNYSPTTLVATPGSKTVLYSGPCRVWEVQGGGPVVIAETDIVQQNTQLSIPWDSTAVIKPKDEVTITAAPTDPQMVGKKFQVASIARAGELRATRRFVVQAVDVEA